jgi:hypothetical protein
MDDSFPKGKVLTPQQFLNTIRSLSPSQPTQALFAVLELQFTSRKSGFAVKLYSVLLNWHTNFVSKLPSATIALCGDAEYESAYIKATL